MPIRHAHLRDLDRLSEIENLCFPPSEGAGRESLRDRIAHYADRFWLYEEDDRVVSFVNGLCTGEPHLRDEMYDDAGLHEKDGVWQMIFGVDTDPAYRGRGFAGTLIRELIRDVRREGRLGVVLTCKEKLIPWYKTFGFEDEGLSDSTHGGVPWHEMRLTFRD